MAIVTRGTPAAFDHWIAGRSSPARYGRYLDSIDPATGAVSARVAQGTAQDVAEAAAAALRAQPSWAAQPPVERSRMLFAVAAAIRDHLDELTELEITPWNGPLNQCARGVAPALAAGNAVLVKPSEFTSATTVTLARIASEAGLPPGVLSVVTGTGSDVGAPMVAHSAVDRVTFTGSVPTGRQVAQAAAERLIPVTLELGGKSPHIIFADADLDRAIEVAVRAFTANAGQVCSAGTRLLVERSVHDAVVERVVSAVQDIELGVDMGPMITADQHRKVHEYFEIAEAEGATLATGGVADGVSGQYVRPTVYTAVSNDMRVAQEEIFGPVLAVIPFDTEEEAVRLANDTVYGLVAGVWTENLSRALRVSAGILAGQVFVNDWAASVEVPFGGYKQSGYGREKGMEALNDYTRLKSVVIRIGA